MRRLMLALAVLGLCLAGTGAFAQGIDEYTVLMLHFNGDFADDSFSNHPVTGYGDVYIDTAEKKFGPGSGLFNATSNCCITAPDHADFDLGSGDFTLDFWVRFNSVASEMAFIGQWDEGWANNKGWYFATSLIEDYAYFRYSTDGSNNFYKFFTGFTPSTDIWYHFALVRNGGDLKFFVNGSQLGSTADMTGVTISDGSYRFSVGGLIQVGFILDGWMDEVRLSKGIARWTSDFTPPTNEYTVGPVYPPVADAGYDIEAYAGEEVMLDGSNSYDPDGEITSWVWRCLSDPQKPIVAEGEITTMITHGYVEELIELTVTDNHGASAADTMKIINPGIEGPQGPEGPQGEVGPQGPQGQQGSPGITPEEIAVIQGHIAGLQQENAALKQQNSQQQQMLDENRYLIEQLPQLRKKIDELESQVQ